MIKFSDYFDSYANVSPKRLEAQNMGLSPGLSVRYAKQHGLTRVTSQSHPELHSLVVDECKRRSIGLPRPIDLPAIYVGTLKDVGGGGAEQRSYSIIFDEGLLDVLNVNEKKYLVAHEIKHLYQGHPNTCDEHHAVEYDSDRAGLESAGPIAVVSYFCKVTSLKRGDGHNGFLKILWSSKDEREYLDDEDEQKHPSNFKRLRAMGAHSAVKFIEERACGRS